MSRKVRIVIELEVESSCFDIDAEEIVNNLAYLISKREYEMRDCCESLFPMQEVDGDSTIYPEQITVSLDEVEAVIWGYQCGDVVEAGASDEDDEEGEEIS